MLLEKTLEVSVSKFEELCKTDARMETLKAYISNEENDIVQCGHYYGVIKYEEGAFIIKWNTKGSEFLRHDLAYWAYLSNVRVVGNVFDKGDTQNFFYIFGGKDERSQDLIQGITLAGMFFDEVALMPESFVNQATGRCSVTGSKFWFNCNPDNPRHWFKVNWIDKCEEKHIIYLHFTMDDNLSLSEKIKERYRSMYVGVFFKRYILGLWCVAEGLVYSMFDEEKHVTDEHMSGALEYVVSIDYGTVNPFSAGLWAFDGKHSQREAELYYNSREVGKRVDDEAYYKMLKELIGDRKVSCIIIDPSAASFIEVIKKYGEYTVRKADNDVLDGIRVVTTMLNKGLLKIYKDCTSCINEFGLYCWDEEKNNDTVIKENDHAMDDTRYYVYTFLRRRLRWKY